MTLWILELDGSRIIRDHRSGEGPDKFIFNQRKKALAKKKALIRSRPYFKRRIKIRKIIEPRDQDLGRTSSPTLSPSEV